MATLVLTTVGTAFGGPIGGAIGALIGQQVDNRLFAPRRRGPRLGDLAVQTSAYGSPIPKLFGTMRVAGTVIWATGLKEDAHRDGNGKTAPKTTRYSYSTSFAVALSGRAIRSVGRIWADGKLLRGAAGDWKSQTGFRIYSGREDQPVDPLIAAVEGAGRAPAYRGMAYAVFEDMQLEDFGNRIPSLSFEIEADEGAVPVSAIAAGLSGGAVGGTTRAALAGYAATGDSVRAAIEALVGAMPVSIADDGARLSIVDAGSTAIDLPDEALGTGAVGVGPVGVGPGDTEPRRWIERQATGALPDEIAITYHAPERDWQAGLQRARRGGTATRTETIELPAALDAGTAKALAERRLAESWAARTRAKARLPWRHIDIRPGASVTSGSLDGHFRVARWTLEHMVLALELTREAPLPPLYAPANPGRALGDVDMVQGGTIAHLLDLPPLEDAALAVARLWIVAAGAHRGWRRALLSTSLDDGATWQTLGNTAAPCVMGNVTSGPGISGSALFDLAGSIEIELLHDGMWLEPRDDAALAAGANLALLGDELIQFGSVTPLGGNRFRLRRLLRGRRGTEWAIAAHPPGTRFILIEAAALAAFDPPVGAIGGRARVLAYGIGDAEPAEAAITIAGHAVRPPTPVALRVVQSDDGGLSLNWTRRSRTGWAWRDGGDAPLAEESERYRISISHGGDMVRTAETSSPAWIYTAGMRAADGLTGTIGIAVVQAGSFAGSLPLQVYVDI